MKPLRVGHPLRWLAMLVALIGIGTQVYGLVTDQGDFAIAGTLMLVVGILFNTLTYPKNPEP